MHKLRFQLSENDAKRLIDSISTTWHHIIELIPGLYTPGRYDPRELFDALNLPESLTGCRVLDIGCRDGFFSFEAEARGAEVVAVDHVPQELMGFALLAKALNSKVRFVNANLFDLSPEVLGLFDYVLFLGVLYHLPDPLRGLRIVRKLCKDILFLESQVLDHALLMPDGSFLDLTAVYPQIAALNLVQFYPGKSLHGDSTNFWAPTSGALATMLGESCFRVLEQKLYGQRIFLKAQAVENPEVARVTEFMTGVAPDGY